MKKLLTILVVAFVGLAKAQQLPEYSQYLINPFIINPAYAGNAEGIPIMLSSRHQWVGFEDAPSTQVLSAHGVSKNYGLGGLIVNDKWGNFNKIGLQLAYAYKTKINNKINFSIGLSASAYQYSLNQTNYNPSDVDDPIISQGKENTFVPNADFGMYTNVKDKWFVGLSVTNLFSKSIKFTSNETKDNKLVRHYFLNGGYVFQITDGIALEPSVLLQSTFVSPFMASVNVRAIYKSDYWVGLSYRTAKDITLMLGLEYKKFVFGYSFDYSTSQISSYSSGTHEIVLGYIIGSTKTKASLN